MKIQFPCFERVARYEYYGYFDSHYTRKLYPCDRQFMRRCFAHWKQELTAKQKRCKTRIVGWAVLDYAKEIWEKLDTKTGEPVKMETLLDGQPGWREYSNGGCSLVCSYTIKERLGKYYPSKTREEEELDVQARFLECAAYRIMNALAYNHEKNQQKSK